MTREEFRFRNGLVSEWDQALADVTHAHRENEDATEDALSRIMDMQVDDMPRLAGPDMAVAYQLMRIGLCTALITIADNLQEEEAA